MRALKYRLVDGTTVTTMKEAKTSGQDYTAFVEKVAEKPLALSPMRKAMLEQFGYVSAILKSKVVL